MKLLRTAAVATLLMAVVLCAATPLRAQDGKKKKKNSQKTPAAVYPVAIFPFQERGRDVADLGQKATDLLFANLVAEPSMYLVDREDLKKVLAEHELNLSGLVAPGAAVTTGQLTGARILVTGSVLQVGDKLYLVAKIIGTETSRVIGASVKGKATGDLDDLTSALAASIVNGIGRRADELVAKPVKREDRIAAIRAKLPAGKRPTVYISVTERHVGQPASDPAAETELSLFCKELGFEVIDHATGNKAGADVLLTGEAFSEFAARHGELVSTKARVELKAVARDTGRLIAIDRHTSVGVDLSEHIAAKSALAEATASIAARLLPKLPAAGGGKAGKKK